MLSWEIVWCVGNICLRMKMFTTWCFWLPIDWAYGKNRFQTVVEVYQRFGCCVCAFFFAWVVYKGDMVSGSGNFKDQLDIVNPPLEQLGDTLFCDGDWGTLIAWSLRGRFEFE